MNDIFAVNLRNWEERVGIHLRGGPGGYNVAAFLDGADTLFPVEATELGDIAGRRLLHLQCHFGLDTLSLARRGAQVTGLDFSPRAIAAARDLARRAGLAANFVEGNVYEAASLTPGPFDIVYTTWGTICWLPDIERWARTIAAVLARGGFLYFADGHPSALALEQVDGRIVPTYPWRTPPEQPIVAHNPTTYTGDPTPLANATTHEWIHPLSDIVSALLAAGLRIEMLHEHEGLPWQLYPMMVRGDDRLYRLPAGMSAMPLAVSLRARRL